MTNNVAITKFHSLSRAENIRSQSATNVVMQYKRYVCFTIIYLYTDCTVEYIP